MPAGLPYFAWIDPTETTFTSAHLRWDESIFSFKLSQEEGDPASLTAVVRRPRNVAGDPIGLLGPGRKIWIWFAFDCGPALIKFRGRLVGVPTSLFEDLVTLEFIAKPIDLVAQKTALANSLRVLPFYDAAVVDPAQSNDPDLVLEGYTKIWHYDRETHVLTVSDEITGEDGTVSFDCADGDVLYDGLGLTLTSGPLARVDVNAEYTWTQQARGDVDLTAALGGWPDAHDGIIPSLNAGDWPKSGSGLGDGWKVAESTAVEQVDMSVKTQAGSASLTIISPDGEQTTATANETISYTTGGLPAGLIVTDDSWSATYSTDGDGLLYTSSYSRNFSSTLAMILVQAIKVTLIAEYDAARQFTERVSFTLFANVQPILTDPEDGEALRLDNIRSINLTEGGQIGDARRRSYIATLRGNQSLEYLICLARANLMKRARVVEITFAPKLARMCEITLRKSAFLAEPRVGQALGKIIGYSLALDGADGHLNCEVRIGCAIGYGGLVTSVDGTPTYCNINYVGHDYQQFINRTILVSSLTDSSVGYQPPSAAPNDDGIDFMGGVSAGQAIEVPLVVETGPAPGTTEPQTLSNAGSTTKFSDRLIAARSERIKNEWMPQYERRGKFKLKSMTREFSTDYVLQVTNLQIPTGYNLEAT